MKVFVEWLNQYCNICIKEVEYGDVVQNGWVYFVFGGKQMIVDKLLGQFKIVIIEFDVLDIGYKFSVDIIFNSLLKIYGGDMLVIILIGMGVDGCEGCRILKGLGVKVWV